MLSIADALDRVDDVVAEAVEDFEEEAAMASVSVSDFEHMANEFGIVAMICIAVCWLPCNSDPATREGVLAIALTRSPISRTWSNAFLEAEQYLRRKNTLDCNFSVKSLMSTSRSTLLSSRFYIPQKRVDGAMVHSVCQSICKNDGWTPIIAE